MTEGQDENRRDAYYSRIARQQCEQTARIYYAFRKRGGTANDLVEIPAMKKLIGDIMGKKVLDAGCGFGFYSIYCVQQGATVTAVDISSTMIELAEKEAAEADVKIDFRVGDAAHLEDVPDEVFDMAISSVAACFNIPLFFKEMARVLKPCGVFCFSDVHPMLGSSKKIGQGKDSVRLVDRYFQRGIRKAMNVFGKINPGDDDYEWQWEHYTLADYCTAMRQAKFLIAALEEPQPDPSTRHLNPDLYDRACKYPFFVLIRAIKKSTQKLHAAIS
jgi:ubiquinone/menaquinone biosynthesis C-methylase UbiE